MNKYPAWLNILVLAILLAGCLFALPNIYGSVEAIQIASNDGEPLAEERLDEFVRTVENAGVTPEAAYLQDGRVVIRFDTTEDQETASARLRDAYSRDANVATTLAPKLPAWVRKLGLKPMSLGLDLRGGVYVLLEVDMATAVEGRRESLALSHVSASCLRSGVRLKLRRPATARLPPSPSGSAGRSWRRSLPEFLGAAP